MSMYRVTLFIRTELDPNDWKWSDLIVTDKDSESVTLESCTELDLGGKAISDVSN